MLTLFVTSLLAAAGLFVEFEENNKHLELNLLVVEAFESGPVIFDVSITNRGTKPLFIRELTHPGLCWIAKPGEWAVQYRAPQSICLVELEWLLDVGKTYTERHTLHHVFRSPFPAGTYQVMAAWSLWTVQKRLKVSGGIAEVPGRLTAFTTKTFTITIAAATGENRKALAQRLEAEFNSLPASSRRDQEEGSEFHRLCDKVIFAPHRELIPLALKLHDRAPAPNHNSLSRAPQRMLVEMVLDADPAAAHHIFVDRLLTTPPQCDLPTVFPLWGDPAREFAGISKWYVAALLNPRCWVNPESWEYLAPWSPVMQLLHWANESAPRMLPDTELRRLVEAKDPRVREAVAFWFGKRLGK
jgi:hypothetical protein